MALISWSPIVSTLVLATCWHQGWRPLDASARMMMSKDENGMRLGKEQWNGWTEKNWYWQKKQNKESEWQDNGMQNLVGQKSASVARDDQGNKGKLKKGTRVTNCHSWQELPVEKPREENAAKQRKRMGWKRTVNGEENNGKYTHSEWESGNRNSCRKQRRRAAKEKVRMSVWKDKKRTRSKGGVWTTQKSYPWHERSRTSEPGVNKTKTVCDKGEKELLIPL